VADLSPSFNLEGGDLAKNVVSKCCLTEINKSKKEK
jgi:hypothetical protein